MGKRPSHLSDIANYFNSSIFLVSNLSETFINILFFKVYLFPFQFFSKQIISSLEKTIFILQIFMLQYTSTFC